MNEFADLNELRQAWISQKFDYPNDINIAGIHYTWFRGSKWDFTETVRDGRNAYVIYHTAATNKQAAVEKGLKQWVVFLWGTPDGITLRPYDMRTITSARGGAMYEQVETIGDVALLKIMLPSGVVALKGKVDTGAEISSLHADGKPKRVGDMIQFFNRNASPNAIQTPMVDQQAVSSADGGTEYRPVIELDVEVNGKAVRKAMFNLNDRSEMEYPVLIGQNILEKTGFLVNPNQDGIREATEEDEWLTEEDLPEITDEDILSLLEDVPPVIELNIKDEELIEQLYNLLDESDVTVSDLFKRVRTKALERLEDIQY